MKKKCEKRKEKLKNEDYVTLPVVFDENCKLALELFFAAAGLERNDSRFVCKLALDSSEPGFLDGMLLTFLKPEEPCSFGAP